MTEDIEKYNTFEGLELYLHYKIRQLRPYCDTLTKFEKERLKFLVRLCKIKSRNRAVAKYLYLKYHYCFKHIGDPKAYKNKRGRKAEGAYPVKYIMGVLNCTRRTAKDYRAAVLVEEKGETLWNLMVSCACETEEGMKALERGLASAEAAKP